jgi:hypothetical protein
VAFDDLNEKPRDYLIAVLKELYEGDYGLDARLGTVWHGTRGEWSQTLAGRQVESPVSLNHAILAELEDTKYILLVDASLTAKEYLFTRRAHDQYRLHVEPPASAEHASEEPGFSFIADPQLRSIIERDYQEIPRCLDARAYKAAIVMCGSVMEALLLDALLADEPRAHQSARALRGSIGKVPRDLGKWTLKRLIAVAQDLETLPTEIGGMSQALRHYRNLIHPAVEIRKQMTAEKEEAELAQKALDVIIKKLA